MHVNRNVTGHHHPVSVRFLRDDRHQLGLHRIITPMGRTLGKPLKGLLQWSTENRAAMAEARRDYAVRKAHLAS